MSDQTAALLSPFLRRQRIRQGVRHARGKVLDYGCGTGKLSEYFLPANYHGTDLDEEVLRLARKKYPSHLFHSLAEFAESKDCFDTIIGLAVIEHLPDPQSFLANLKKRLKPDGRIVLTTPNPVFGWIHHLGSKMGLFSAEADKEHEQLINHKKMQILAANSGLRIILSKKFLWGANQLFVLESVDKCCGPEGGHPCCTSPG